MQPSDLVRRWIVSMAVIALALTWLHQLGAGDLGAPPLSIDGAVSWLETHDMVVAVFALLRLIALAFGWYLLLVTAVGGAVRSFRLPRMTAAVDRVTVPFARGMLGGMALLGVMGAPPQPQQPDAMIELPSDSTSTTVPTAQATLHLLPEAPPAPAPTSSPAAPLPDDANTWVIQHGESFWTVATDHLADVRGRPVTEQEIAPFWRQVVELNRSRLVNPHDADLLFIGQVIELPAIAPG